MFGFRRKPMVIGTMVELGQLDLNPAGHPIIREQCFFNFFYQGK
jgi:hypothetical protein